MVKEIILTQGKVALVDDEDYEKVKDINFYVNENHGNYYARSNTKGKHRQTLLLHRLVLNLNRGQQCDHVNGNGLDNRRCNLRVATNSENRRNSKKQFKKASSQFKGVSWHRGKQKWQTKIRLDKKDYQIGTYQNEVEAAKAYDEVAKILFREYARLNFGGNGE